MLSDLMPGQPFKIRLFGLIFVGYRNVTDGAKACPDHSGYWHKWNGAIDTDDYISNDKNNYNYIETFLPREVGSSAWVGQASYR